MVELDPPCMKKMAALGDALAPVKRVADHRMPNRGEMRPDLMHDAGLDLHFEKRRVRAAATRPKARDSGPGAARGFLAHSHFAAVARVRLDRSLHLARSR